MLKNEVGNGVEMWSCYRYVNIHTWSVIERMRERNPNGGIERPWTHHLHRHTEFTITEQFLLRKGWTADYTRIEGCTENRRPDTKRGNDRTTTFNTANCSRDDSTEGPWVHLHTLRHREKSWFKGLLDWKWTNSKVSAKWQRNGCNILQGWRC